MPSPSRPWATWSALLVRLAIVSAVLCTASLIGLLVDSRVVGGAPAWLKPAKFGASGAVYLLTLAWMTQDLRRTRLLRIAQSVIGVIIVAEIVVIMVQAARGRLSHFNIDTPLDIALFSGMGIGIATVWGMSMVLLVLHVRTHLPDRALAWAFRAGLLLNIAGAGVGWTMTQPRPNQLAAMQRGERPYVAGSHTVGGQDGGPGLPVTRWSRDHGDLRVPHFVGMHALQLLPLLLLGARAMRHRRDDQTEFVLLIAATTVCCAMFAGALWQALHDRPLEAILWR